VTARLRQFVDLWIELFAKHALLDRASATAFAVLKALLPLTLLGLALLGAVGQERVWEKTLAPPIEPQVQPATFQAIDAALQQIFATGSTGLVVFAGAHLTVFLVLTGYIYTSSIIFLVGVKPDELLREDATEGQRALLGILRIAS
jgi:uncharacterized BrkB/YihY/UPF0761 family membrane protein